MRFSESDSCEDELERANIDLRNARKARMKELYMFELRCFEEQLAAQGLAINRRM